jgi:hypothetical protein
MGVKAASGTILAFTDSDCVPNPVWLEEAVRAFSGGADLVHGLTKPMRYVRPLEHSVGSGTEGLFPTCNVLYRRDLYERLGGFDSSAASRLRFRFTRRARGYGFGEDTLLGWQAVRSGATVRFVPEAVVEHQVLPIGVTELVGRCAQSAAFPALAKEAPELRQTLLRRGIFLGGRSRLPVYATALSLASRNRRLVGLSVAWWVLLRLRDLHRSPLAIGEQLRFLPVEMAVDAMTGSALVVGSIRAQVLVL